MKSINATIILLHFFIASFGQTFTPESSSLGVEKKFQTRKKLFVFKPHRYLTLKTENGIIYDSDKYSFSDKYIVMDMKDTILFNNILWIKGRVYGDKGRKIAGVISFCAADVGILTVAALILSGGPVLPMSILVAGTIFGGVHAYW